MLSSPPAESDDASLGDLIAGADVGHNSVDPLVGNKLWMRHLKKSTALSSVAVQCVGLKTVCEAWRRHMPPSCLRWRRAEDKPSMCRVAAECRNEKKSFFCFFRRPCGEVALPTVTSGRWMRTTTAQRFSLRAYRRDRRCLWKRSLPVS